MIETIGWFPLVFILGIGLGNWIGAKQTNNAWSFKATLGTAEHYKGKFYYVLHEKDYCDMRIAFHKKDKNQ